MGVGDFCDQSVGAQEPQLTSDGVCLPMPGLRVGRVRMEPCADVRIAKAVEGELAATEDLQERSIPRPEWIEYLMPAAGAPNGATDGRGWPPGRCGYGVADR